METLRRKPVARESDVFAALFPRAITPQHDADKLPLLREGDEIRGGTIASSVSETTGPATDGRRPPKLSALAPKTPRSLMTSLPMTESDCTVVWKFLCDWVKAQIAMEAPATIPGLGTVSLRTQALKIRMPFFDPDRAFLDKHGLSLESTSTLAPLQRTGSSSTLASPRGVTSQRPNGQGTNVDVLSFSFMEMAACCGKHVEQAKAKEWLQTLLQKLGEAMRQCPRIEIDFGVGVVACSNRVIESHMLPRHTSTPSKVPFEIRTGESVVKRSLQIPASPSGRATSSTFLAGSQFSPAIRLNPAMPNDGSSTAALFKFDSPSGLRLKPKQSPRTLMAVLPGSAQGGNGASPRTLRLRNQPHGESQTPVTDKATSSSLSFPALFDSISRTFCVEPDLNLAFLQPSNRIASNYSPAAAGLLIVKSTHSSSRYSSSMSALGLVFTDEKLPCDAAYPDETLTHGKPSSREGRRDHHAPSEERYFAYLNEANRLMDEAWLAPLAPTLVNRIVASAVKYLNATPTGHMKAVLHAAQEEFVSNYNTSVKKAILDYLLLRTAARKRLGILSGTPSHTTLPLRWQWGNSKGANGCMQDLQALAASSLHRRIATRPFSPLTKSGRFVGAAPPRESSLVIKKRRRKRVKAWLAANFMLSDVQIRALHYLWYDFEAELMLVKLPTVEQLSERMEPIDLLAFEKEQLAHAFQVKSYLTEHWYDRSRQVFEQAIGRTQRDVPYTSGEVARLRHFFDAVATQMSLQIRSLILKSIRAYLEFFELFGASKHGTSGDEASNQRSNYSALLVSLTLQENAIQFTTPLVEIPSMILGVLHNLPQLFHNVNRIEKQFQGELSSLFSASSVASNNEIRYSPFLWNVSSQEDEIVVATMRIREIIEQNLKQLHQLQAEYSQYGATYHHISTMPAFEEHFDGWDESNSEHEINQWYLELQRVRDVAQSLVQTTRPCRFLNLFSVDCHHVNSSLLAAYAKWSHRLLGAFASRTAGFNAQLRQQYKDVAARLAKRPLDLYDLVEAEEFVELLKTSKLRELQVKVEGIKHRMQFLLFRRGEIHIDGPETLSGTKAAVFEVPNELLASTAKTIRWRTHIERLLQDAEASLVGERARIEAVFLAKRNRFQAEIEEFDAEVKSFSKKGDLRHAATYVVQLSKMKEALVGFKKQMESIVEEEAKLQWKGTDFSKLDDIAEEMEPYEQLWKTAREFRELNSRWLRTNVFELQAHEGLQSLQQMMATITNVSNLLHLNSAAAAITAEMLKKQMSDFRENAKLVAAILNPSVQERHLKEISMLLALTIDPQEPITLLKLLENGAYDHLPRIVDISENATMEKQIEDALRVIDNAWHGVRIQFKEPASRRQSAKGQGSSAPSSLMKTSVEDIKLLVEDHQLRLQTLQCLPHAVPFFQDIARWLSFLHDVYQIVDLMVVNERLWKRLSPLFTAQIIEDTAEEFQHFSQADLLYWAAVARVVKQPVCRELVADALDPLVVYGVLSVEHNGYGHIKLLDELNSCQELLERVRDTVSVGFEQRRLQFPRFFLLSDNELVSVLASCPAKASTPPPLSHDHADGDPLSATVTSPQLWRHLQLCFPGVRRVLTNTSSPNQELTAFTSAHGEQVPIGTPIATAAVPIISWLSKLETAMITILQACTRAAISDFARKEFRKWCLLWPEQVLCITIIHTWTMLGESNNRKPSLSETRLGWQAEVQALSDKCDAVTRELKAASTPSTRLTLSNVILLLNHLRDVSGRIVEDLATMSDPYPSMVQEEDGDQQSPRNKQDPSSPPPSVNDQVRESMTWLAQPRLYYDSNASLGVKVLSFAPLPYGFEYSGNASQVVSVTPLTLRCFHALALHAGMLHKGSSVRSFGGKGTKATCEMIARQCGRLFIHFESQDHPTDLRFLALVQFLKATVACGAWMMMTGVQSLQPNGEYATLLASMCSQIMDCHAAKLNQCMVLGTKLKLKRGVHFLVVSSSVASGLGGRSQVVDEYLRSFFRPVEMQVHDLNTLTEFFLQQAKMIHTKELARVINSVVQALDREMELLMDGERTEYAHALRGQCTSVRALRDLAARASELSAQERLMACAAHGWPPQAPNVQVSTISSTMPPHAHDKEMSQDLVREIERIEHRAVCIALREFISALVPSRAAELIDDVLRDVAANSRELRMTRSFLISGTSTTGAKSNDIESAISKSARASKVSPQEQIEQIIRSSGLGKWPFRVDTELFCSKARQLYESLQSNRTVVVVGDVQTGKTTLWQAVADAVSQLRTETAHAEGAASAKPDLVRTVVIHPRALTLDQMFGSSPKNGVLPKSDPLITHLARDAKAQVSTEQRTWLVFDSDVNETWAGRLVQVTETRTEEEATAERRDRPGYDSHGPTSRLPGILLPNNGKRLVLPLSVSVIVETTALKDISPGFLTKVGVVHVGDLVTTSTKVDWRGIYCVWKARQAITFAALRDELFSLLDVLTEEVVDASLEFVASNFEQERRFQSYSASATSRSLLLVWRMRGFLALLHSFLLQSWPKLSAMVSGKQRKIAIHCYFLQAVVWGIGHTSNTSERLGFHAFLRQWIIQGPRSADSSLKRAFILFFPSGTMGSAATGLQGLASGLPTTQRNLDLSGGSMGMNRETMYNFGFSVELGSKWMRWADLYESWLADTCQLNSESGFGSKPASGGRSTKIPSVPEYSSSESSSSVTRDTSRNGSLFVRTSNSSAAMFMLYQLMASGYPVLLCGPQDAAKTTCGRTWLDLHRLLVQLQRDADAVSATSMAGDGSSSQEYEAPVNSEHIYSGLSVTARHVLEQLDTFVERKRVRRGRGLGTGQDAQGRKGITSSMLVFVDDLHRLPTDQVDDCALELVRGILEHHQVVHPTANSAMRFGASLAPFAALQDTNGRGVSRGLQRVATRFVPIALTATSDIELSTICSAFVSSLATTAITPSDGMDMNASDAMGYSAAMQEASQLISMITKATVKMYRVLSGDHWAASNHLHQATVASRTFAATIAFQPAKAHYLFHVQDTFDVLRSVCCDTKQSLLMTEKSQVAKLWCHETARVFGDRLSDENDSLLFYQLLSEVVSSHFSLTPDALIPSDVAAATSNPNSNNAQKNHTQALWLRDQLFYSFIGESSGAGMADGYREVQELQKVELSIERTMMAMYRSNIATESLPFVLCTHAMRHIMRLTRVLRHNDGSANLVLLGRHGSKMRTLTRLAAFICHKSSTTFYTQANHNGLNEWRQFLKSALLQCVCQHREDRLVVIIKDMWLSNLEIYASLDRYLSGGKLLSDVISYEDFTEPVLQTLREEAERDRRGDGLASHDPNVFMNFKSSVVEYFFAIVRRKLQFVVILSMPPPDNPASPSSRSFQLARLMASCPYLQKNSVIDVFGDWPEESLHAIAQKCFAPMFATERDRLLQLSQVAVQIYLRTRVAWAAWSRGDQLPVDQGDDKARPRTSGGDADPASTQRKKNKSTSLAERDRPSAFIQIDPSMLVEQIVLFLAHLPHLQRDVDANKVKYAAGLEFMTRTEQILALEQSQQQILQPEMEKKTAVTRRMSGNLEKEKLTSAKLHNALEMETALVESQRTRLVFVESEYDDLIRETRTTFETRTEVMRAFLEAIVENENELSSDVPTFLPQAQLGEIRSADSGVVPADEEDEAEAVMSRQKGEGTRRVHRSMVRSFIGIPQPATSLRQLAECLGFIFGIDPVESRDELDPEEIVMDYWGTVTQRMRSVDFWKALVDFDVRQRMTEAVVAGVLPICTSPDFGRATFASIHDVAVLLCEWVQACADYARDFVLAEPKYSQLCNERLAYEAAVAQMRARQFEIETQTTTTSTVNAMRTLSEQERREIEDKLKGTTSTLQMTTAVWKVLEPGKPTWRQLYEHYTQFGVQAMGDLMLATATMVYASSATSAVRTKLRGLWSDALNLHYVVHSPQGAPRPMHQVFLVDDRTLTKWQIENLPCQDVVCLESAVIATKSFLFPVIVDPHHVATAWFKRQCQSGMDQLSSTDTSNEASIAIVSGTATRRDTLWDTISQSIKKKRPVIVESFNEAQALELVSLLQSKRRSRFDVVNRDLSSVTGGGVSTPQAGSAAGSLMMRRTSSVGIGLGISSTGGSSSHGLGSTTAYGVNGNHRCWFEVPQSTAGKAASESAVVECGSESCRVYFIYTESEVIPEWLGALASQVALIRFEFSLAQIRSKSLKMVLDAHGGAHSQVLTEIQALQVDMISCDEQIETIENEILDFFSVEDPALVYNDTAKALKIVGNRSSLHTLENSKLEASKKIQQHYIGLASYSMLVRRSIEVLSTWRDVSAMWLAESSCGSRRVEMSFPTEWIWASLTQALHSYGVATGGNSASSANCVGSFTTLVRQCVHAAYSATSDLPPLFDFLLSLRLHSRRLRRSRGLISVDSAASVLDDDAVDEEADELHDVVPRLVQLLECKDESQLRTLCAGVASKLLTARPGDIIPVHKWRPMCFLAEKLQPLRDLMVVSQQGSAKDIWKDALALDQLQNASGSYHWSPKLEVDALSRLCIVAVLQKRAFWSEVDAFINHELAWHPSVMTPEEIKPVVEKAASTGGDRPSVEASDAEASTTSVESVPVSSNVSVMPHSLEDLWRLYSSTQSPIFLICQPETELIREVQVIAVQANATLDVTTREAQSDETFEESLRTAIQKGIWVVLPRIDAHATWHSIIARLLATIHTHEPHPDFRLWLSAPQPLESIVRAGITVVRCVKRNEFVFTTALRQAWLLLDGQYQRYTKQQRPTKQPAVGRSAQITNLLLRVGVLHALLTCGDHLVHASWKTNGESITDDALVGICNVILTQAQIHEDIASLTPMLTTQAYGVRLHSSHDLLLLTHCVELVFTNENQGFDSTLMDSALRAIPEVAQVIRRLDDATISATSTLADFVSFICGSSRSSSGGSSQLIRYQQAQKTVGGLRRVLEYQGLLSSGVAKSATTPATPSRGGVRGATVAPVPPFTANLQAAPYVLDALARFVTEIEGYDFDTQAVNDRCPVDYKQPLNELLQCEVALLRATQRGLIDAIKLLQQVSQAGDAPDPVACEQFAALLRGDTPSNWLQFVAKGNGDEDPGDISFEVFQQTVLERLRFFQAWIDHGQPSRLAIDKLHCSLECVFEAIHQHFVRNLVGSMRCGGSHQCIRVVRLYEDRPHIVLPARDETLYLSGWRVHGHLQLEIGSAPSPEQPRKRSHTPKTPPDSSLSGDTVRLEGTPVIVEITTTCLVATNPGNNATTNALASGSMRQLPLSSAGAGSNTSSRRSSLAQQISEFLCPVQRMKDDRSVECATVVVPSMLPIPQLVFSGSHLSITTLDEQVGSLSERH